MIKIAQFNIILKKFANNNKFNAFVSENVNNYKKINIY